MPFRHKPHELLLHLRKLRLRVEVVHRFPVVRLLARGDVERGEEEGAHGHAHLALGAALDGGELGTGPAGKLVHAVAVAQEGRAQEHQTREATAHRVAGKSAVAVVVEGLQQGGVLHARLRGGATSARAAQHHAENLALRVLHQLVAVVLADHGVSVLRLVEHVLGSEGGEAEVERAAKHVEAHRQGDAAAVVAHLEHARATAPERCRVEHHLGAAGDMFRRRPYLEKNAAVAARVDEPAHRLVGDGQAVLSAIAVEPQRTAGAAGVAQEEVHVTVARADEDVPLQGRTELVVRRNLPTPEGIVVACTLTLAPDVRTGGGHAPAEELVGDEVLERGKPGLLAADVLLQEPHLDQLGVGRGHDEPLAPAVRMG